MRRAALIAAMLALAPVSALAQVAPRAGDSVEITRDFQTEQHNTRGMSGTTSDQDSLLERVVAVRDDGVELEYQLGNEGDRSSSWTFPARVIRPSHGPLRLANPAEWEGRIDAWLKGAGMTRAACGHWIFTWNAFRIDCDPQSVIKSIEAFELYSGELREGVAYSTPIARGSAPLVRKSDRNSPSSWRSIRRWCASHAPIRRAWSRRSAERACPPRMPAVRMRTK